MKKRSITLIATFALALLSSAQEQKKPLKVYILAGPSNMTGMVSSGTLEHLKMFPDTAKEFAALFDKNGSPLEPRELKISDSTGAKRTLTNILVGGVWVASGQSNMNLTVSEKDPSKQSTRQAR